jgi:hypothetical protein
MKILKNLFKRKIVVNYINRTDSEINDSQVLAIRMKLLLTGRLHSITSNCQTSVNKVQIGENKYEWQKEIHSYCKTCRVRGILIQSMIDELNLIIKDHNIEI